MGRLSGGRPAPWSKELEDLHGMKARAGPDPQVRELTGRELTGGPVGQ